MAKKKDIAPSALTMEEKLKTLYQLQQLLSQIDEIRILRGELPLEVEDLENEIEGLRTRLENLTNEARDIRANINELKTQIDIANSKLIDYKGQLDHVRNNREYEMLTKEIEYQELQLQLCSKRIEEAKTVEMAKQEAIEQTQQAIEQHTVDLEAKKGELDTIIADTQAEEEKLTEKAKNLELCIEERLLGSFLRIRSNTRNGLGIVYVNRDACGGCFAKIPPQRQLDVRQRRKLIVCEYCGRILIDPELAGVKSDKPVEEKPKRRRTATRSTKTAKTTPAAKSDSPEDSTGAPDPGRKEQDGTDQNIG